ncbi:MAG: Rab family GTPase, partial [Promethearchaeota archaeon]
PKGNFFMKVIVIGDYEVGKTAITRRFVENSFDERYLPTLQLKISKKKLNFGYTDVTIMIWDIGGQVIHMSPYRNQFYEGAQSGVIIVDRTRKKTIENAEKWFKDTNKAIPKKIPFILVGNKSDLIDEIVVSEQDIKCKADKLNLDYLLTSAKTGDNINELFHDLTYLFFENQNF